MSRRPEPRSARRVTHVSTTAGSPDGSRVTTRTTRVGAVLALAGMLAISACAPAPAPTPRPSSSGSAASSTTPAPSSAPTTDPVLVPGGSANDNLPLFSEVTASVWATPANVNGRAYIDALVAAGFDKAAMQVTHDQSTVGNPAESIQFAVHWQSECLVGQVGPASGAPVTVVVPALAGGACLVGATRPIDW